MITSVGNDPRRSWKTQISAVQPDDSASESNPSTGLFQAASGRGPQKQIAFVVLQKAHVMSILRCLAAFSAIHGASIATRKEPDASDG